MPGGALNYGFNGQAAIALARSPESAVARSLVPGLVRARGLALPPSVNNRQDNSIQAWSWTDGTFSWVESTAWCLSGSSASRHARADSDVRARFEDGRRFFVDRVCKEGGWNDGNSNMLGADLPPYIPTTALALLAMHDRAADPVLQRGLTYLGERKLTEQGGLALSLTRICLGVYGEAGADVEAAILSTWTRTAFSRGVHVTALGALRVDSQQPWIRGLPCLSARCRARLAPRSPDRRPRRRAGRRPRPGERRNMILRDSLTRRRRTSQSCPPIDTTPTWLKSSARA